MLWPFWRLFERNLYTWNNIKIAQMELASNEGEWDEPQLDAFDIDKLRVVDMVWVCFTFGSRPEDN